MHLHIRSIGPRFRRAGIEFTSAGLVIDAATIAAESLAAIKAECRLLVTEADAPTKPKGKAHKADQSPQGSAAGDSPQDATSQATTAAAASDQAPAKPAAKAPAAKPAKPAKPAAKAKPEGKAA